MHLYGLFALIRQIASAYCIGCGENCGFSKVLCDACVATLEQIKHYCNGCGHATAVPTDYCRYCSNEKLIGRYYADYAYTGALRVFIKALKFKWQLRGAGQLKELIHYDRINPLDYDYCLPVPYHLFRRFSRFWQPVDILAKGFADYGIEDRYVLDRVVNTAFQFRKSRTKRFENVKGVFKINKSVENDRILLVDDIITSGATISECAKVLRKAGASKVDVYTLVSGV